MKTKTYLLIPILFTTFLVNAQNKSTDLIKKEVIATVDSFFMALNKQDSAMLGQYVLREGQVWSLVIGQEKKFKSRHFSDDMKQFNHTYEWEEIAKGYEVQFREGLAIAWVPYEFYLNGKFSHSGMDLFTLVPYEESWKIIQISYTVKKEK